MEPVLVSGPDWRGYWRLSRNEGIRMIENRTAMDWEHARKCQPEKDYSMGLKKGSIRILKILPNCPHQQEFIY